MKRFNFIKLSLLSILTSIAFVNTSFAQYRTLVALPNIQFKHIDNLLNCDIRFKYQVPGTQYLSETIVLKPTMIDLKKSATYKTASIRLPLSAHMMHTLGIAKESSDKVGYGAVDEHLEITVIRHDPSIQNVAFDGITDTAQAGLSNVYVASTTVPNFYTSYFHQFLDISNWTVEINSQCCPANAHAKAAEKTNSRKSTAR